MKKPLLLLCLLLPSLLLGSAVMLSAQALAANSRAEREVMAVEQARVAALEHSDVAALERIMADDVTYVHASGKTDTKKSYLDAIRSGQLHYISWQPKNLHVRVTGTSAAVNGQYTVHVIDTRLQQAPLDLNLYILTVYAFRDGRWQQIAWQSTHDTSTAPVN